MSDGQDSAEAMALKLQERAAALAKECRTRHERQVKALLECRHQRQADQCHECKGMTSHGIPLDPMLEALRQEGLIEVEAAVELRVNDGKPVRHQRNLKKIAGIGIGIGFFIGLAGWEGGKLIWRLVKKDTPKSS